MRIITVRALFVGLIVISIIPLVAGLSASFVMIGAGMLQAMNESVSKGLTLSIVAVFAFFGVFTLGNLCIHYVKTPFLNPAENKAKKYGVGLVFGWASLLLMWFGAIGNIPEIGVGILSLMPCAVVVSLWWLVNVFRTSVRG